MAKAKKTKRSKATSEDGSDTLAKKIWLAGIGAYGKSVEDAQEQLDRAGQEVSRHFNELVDKGLVRREQDAQDRRRLVLHATNTAAIVLQQSTVEFAGVAAAMLERLSEDERADLVRLLRLAAPTLPRLGGSDPEAREG